MKQLLFSSLAAIAMIAIFGLTGQSATSSGKIDTSKIVKAFQNATPAAKAEAQNALTAIRAQNYPGALSSLEKVVTSAETTPEQKSAAKDLITQVQTKGLGGAMGGTGDVTNRVTGGFTNQIHRGADKATDELQKPFKQ